jgi:hypothetical protein
MALRRRWEKYGPPVAISRVNTIRQSVTGRVHLHGRYEIKKAKCCLFQWRASRCIARSGGTPSTTRQYITQTCPAQAAHNLASRKRGSRFPCVSPRQLWPSPSPSSWIRTAVWTDSIHSHGHGSRTRQTWDRGRRDD